MYNWCYKLYELARLVNFGGNERKWFEPSTHIQHHEFTWEGKVILKNWNAELGIYVCSFVIAAIKQVFPDGYIIFCRVHIGRNIWDKVGIEMADLFKEVFSGEITECEFLDVCAQYIANDNGTKSSKFVIMQNGTANPVWTSLNVISRWSRETRWSETYYIEVCQSFILRKLCKLIHQQNGEGVEQNYSEAARYFKMSADQGNSHAQCNYGLCLYEGQGVR